MVGPDAHHLEVDLLEGRRALADLDDVGPGRDERPDERRASPRPGPRRSTTSR